MGEAVQLINMKQYTLERLSVNGAPNSNGGPKTNGVTPNGHGANGPTRPHQNGFMSKTEYGDWDTATSPVSSPTDKESPASLPTSPARQPPRRVPSSARSQHMFIPEHEIDIPRDGSLFEFSADDMSTFLRYLGVEERIVTHVHKKSLDGVKFSKLKDSDLEALSMKNPIICHFRDRSIREKGGKKKKPFML